MQVFIDVLKQTDLFTANGPSQSLIDSLSLSKIVDITETFEQSIRSEYHPANKAMTAHFASSSLSGDTSDCDYIGCRLNRINQLARFALMYSNKVFFKSVFTKYSCLNSNDQLSLAKIDLYNDLRVLYEIRSLLEQGFIQMYVPDSNSCYSCQARKFLNENAAEQLDVSYKRLVKEFLDDMRVEAALSSQGYAFSCAGSKPYFDHAHVKIEFSAPIPLQKRPTILNKIEHGQKINLSKTLIADLGFHHDHAYQVVSNAMLGLDASSCLNTSFLTNNNLHIDFLNSLQSDYDVSRRNLIAAKHLTSIVPYIEDINLNP
jgi:hypothetical protein